MAKDEEMDMIDEDLDDDEEEEGKKGKKMMGAIIAVFIVIIWIAIFCLLVKLDVGGFGSSVLYPVLKDVPVINKILPSVDDEELSDESGTAYKTLQDAVDRINELEAELEVYQQKADENAETISDLTAENAKLKTYENNQQLYEELKRKFDEEVVYNDKAPELEEYKTWYESMDEENAAEIYRQVLEQLEMDEKIQELANYYSSMKASAAAAIFEEMTGDLEKVASILSCMKSDAAADILAAMDSTLAAKLTLLIYPTGSSE